MARRSVEWLSNMRETGDELIRAMQAVSPLFEGRPVSDADLVDLANCCALLALNCVLVTGPAEAAQHLRAAIDELP